MFQCRAKEAFGSSAIPSASYEDVDHVSVLIDCAPQVVALATNLDEELVDEPDVTEPTLLSSNRSSVSGTELQAPVSNCLA